MIKLLALFGLGLLLTGCGASSPWGEANTGGAVYNYVSTEGNKTCRINGTSAREVSNVEIVITDDCGMKVTADNSTPIGDALGAINGLVDRLPRVEILP